MNHVLAWGDLDSGRSVYGFARLWVCSFMGLLVYGPAKDKATDCLLMSRNYKTKKRE
jgi:hypothetical protein